MKIKVLTHCEDGLPVSKEAYIEVSHDNELIQMNEIKYVGLKSKILNTYKIKLENVIDIIVANETEILEKNKSAIARGAVGYIAFGPVGAMLGGMSALDNRKKYKKLKQSYLVISYTSKDGEIKNITFDLFNKMVIDIANKFVKEIKKLIPEQPLEDIPKEIPKDIEL